MIRLTSSGKFWVTVFCILVLSIAGAGMYGVIQIIERDRQQAILYEQQSAERKKRFIKSCEDSGRAYYECEQKWVDMNKWF